MTTTAVEPGQLVRVRGQQWVVSEVRPSTLPVDELAATPLQGQTLVTLTSVSEDDLGEELSVIWEVEPGRAVVPAGELPEVPEPSRWDDPQRLGALLDAVRWGTVASADVTTLQAPFRSGIQIKGFQLEPVAKALRMPRIGLLVADDVGLGKTIEAGLVIQELLLRHRARRVIVVCPASLTLKWREEMIDKFGLDFAVLDTAALKDLRRTHGLQANPFTVFPRMIISLPWLRTPRVQRLLDEVLDDTTRHQGFFDLLVVDEAHHVAPPAPSRERGYAVDSQQTKAVRRLSEHSQHRVMLSATPHNGYAESWQALLELVDPRRFARGVIPDRAALDEVLIRRLKDEIVDADGNPEFARRLPAEILEVTYTDGEREGHRLLQDYTAHRTGSTKRNDLVTLLLKKRLFSSPAAFQATVEQHARTVAKAATGDEDPVDVDYDWDDEPDDAAGSEAEEALFLGAATALSTAADETLTELRRWAAARVGPADTKAERLVSELTSICRPGGTWTDERVIVFTEYRATQVWLASLLNARGLGGDHLGLLHGGMQRTSRERLKAAFQAAPDRPGAEVRILLATDAASEGIDLQNHCCRVIHYDIPFNPNRLEQRIGRVDRFGQRRDVHVAHFAGTGWESAEAGSYEADLEFLSRVAEKVAQERADLGRVNPVLAKAVESRMLGRSVPADPFTVGSSPIDSIRAERDLREQVRRLREQLDTSTRSLHVAPPNLRRVVDTALDLAGQPRLIDTDDGLIAPPVLTRGWERTVEELVDPLDAEVRRPLTFDSRRADGTDGRVVLSHVGSPLVAQAQRLLRSAVWGEGGRLSRVTGVTAPMPAEALRPGELLICVLTRFLVVGADGQRLHEEVMLSGRALPTEGRSRRLVLEEQRFDDIRLAVEAALEPDTCHPASKRAEQRLVAAWPSLVESVQGDLAERAQVRRAGVQRALEARRVDEVARVEAVGLYLRRSLSEALDEGPRQLSFEDLDQPERRQVETDRAAWRARLDGLDEATVRDLAAVDARYGRTRDLTFPVAVVLVEPV